MERKFPVVPICTAALASAVSVWAALIADPIPLSTQGNLLLDRDNDGRMDAIQLEFVSPVSTAYLAQQLDSVVLTWPDTSGLLLTISAPGNQFQADSAQPKRMTWFLPATLPVARNLTSIDSGRYLFPYGTAKYYGHGNQTPSAVHIDEAMAPVVTLANLASSRFSGSPDTLRIHLSEPVAPPVDAGTAIFTWSTSTNSAALDLQSTYTHWTSASVVLLQVQQGSGPAVGDSISLRTDALRDLQGNSPGAAPSSRVVTGHFPFLMETQPKAQLDANSPEWWQRPLFQVEFLPFGDTLEEADWLGAGMDFGSTSLLNTLQEQSGDSIPDPSATEWTMELWVYAMDGQPVHRSRLQISCADPRFAPSGNCFQDPAKVFLRWNLRTVGGRAPATGAYLARISNRMTYDGKTIFAATPESQGGTAIWGILRRNSGEP